MRTVLLQLHRGDVIFILHSLKRIASAGVMNGSRAGHLGAEVAGADVNADAVFSPGQALEIPSRQVAAAHCLLHDRGQGTRSRKHVGL